MNISKELSQQVLGSDFNFKSDELIITYNYD